MNSKLLGQALIAPETYRTDASYHKLFTRLRAEQPVAYCEPEGYRPFWAITKHADIRSIELQADLFTNKERSFLLSIEDEMRLLAAQQAGITAMGRSVVQLDGQDHRSLRKITQAWFATSSVKRLEEQIRAIARQSIDQMVTLDGSCDFVKDIALWYPLRVILAILGVLQSEEAHLLKLTQAMFAPSDPDTDAEAGVAGMIAASQGIRDYFEAVTIDRRRNPRDDVASIVANAVIDGERISDLDAIGYYVTIITAGHDTTSSSTSAGLLALLQHPEEMTKLRSGAASLDTAVDEFLRWGTPIKHFFRTAQKDHELRGQHIRAGDSLMMCYPSANRDEGVFEDPFAFKVDRTPNPQLAFGFGPHVCLGQHLAKLEMKIFFAELIARIDEMTLAGEAALTEANFVQGLKSLPLTYSVRRRAA